MTEVDCNASVPDVPEANHASVPTAKATAVAYRSGKIKRKEPTQLDNAAFEANLACIKSTVGCNQVAELEVELHPSGKHLRGRCPLPDHNGDSPSFYAYADAQGWYGSWHCHRCNAGGDVIDLYGRMYGLDHSLITCLQDLAERYGIRLWRDSDLMSDNQLAIRRARIQAERALNQCLMGLYFKLNVMPEIMRIEDPVQRADALDDALRMAGLDEGSR